MDALSRVDAVYCYDTIGRGYDGTHGIGKTLFVPFPAGVLPELADHEHGPVGEVDHLVRGAAEDEPGQVAPAPAAHHDDAHVVLLRQFDDLRGGAPERDVCDLGVGGDPRLGQGRDRGLDLVLRLAALPGGDQPEARYDLALPHVHDPDLALGQAGQFLGCGQRPVRGGRVVDGHENLLVHRGPPKVRSFPGGLESSRYPPGAPGPWPTPRPSAPRGRWVPGCARWTCRRRERARRSP